MNALIRKACAIVDDFATDPGMSYFFEYCHGIVVFSAIEIAALVSGSHGSGVILRHAQSKWSPPCAITMNSIGAGAFVGMESKDVIMFLTEPAMVRSLAGEFQIRIGEKISFTTPQGGQEDDFHFHFSGSGASTTTSFGKTKGLMVGISMEGGVIKPNSKVNKEYYGEPVPAKKILFGEVSLPTKEEDYLLLLKALHNSLDVAGDYESSIQYKDTIPNPFLKKAHVNKVETK